MYLTPQSLDPSDHLLPQPRVNITFKSASRDHWRNIVESGTKGFTRAEIATLVGRLVSYQTCLWHEVTKLVNERDGSQVRCPCLPCSKGRKRRVPMKFTVSDTGKPIIKV